MLNTIYGSKNMRRSNIREDNTNPKTMPLDNLVQQIDSQALAYYLEQTSIFLKSTKKDVWFPRLSPHLDALLVRMIKDVQNITKLLDAFDSKSKIFAIEIIDALKQNQNIYSLSYSYENSNIDHDILVYRKVFKDKQLNSPTKKSNINSSSNSQNKDSESLKPSNKQNTSPDVDWVKATLKFVKDSTLDTLEYPIMSFEEANLVHSVVRLQSDVDVTPLGPLCIELLDAIKLLNETQELKASYLYVASDKVRLSIEKKPLNNNNLKKKELNNKKTSNTVTETKSKFAKKLELLENLDKSFVSTSLKMILDFLSTEEEASVRFRNANEHQCTFIQSACAIAKTPKFYILFPSKTVDVLKNINKILSENQCYDIKIDVAKVQKDNKLRTVSLTKNPRFSEKKSLAKDNDRVHSPNSSLSRSESIDRKNVPKKNVAFQSGGKLEHVTGGIVTVDRASETPMNADKQDKSVPVKDKENIVPKTQIENKNVPVENVKKDTQKNSKIVPTGKSVKTSPITVNKENTQTTDKTPKTKNAEQKLVESKGQTRLSRIDTIKQNESSDTKRAVSVPPQTKDKVDGKTKDTAIATIDNKGLCMRKLKLLNAMSVPMESDIAMRMMKQMGWQGGPLGLRGEGITEPIVPALHLSPGAGLGHVKPQNKSKITGAFRYEFLKEVLYLLKQDWQKRIIEFKTPLTNSQKKYIVNTVRLCNERKEISQESEEAATVVVNEVMEELLCEPDVCVSCAFSVDKGNLVLTKYMKPSEAKEPKTLPTNKDKEIKQKCTKLPILITAKNAKSIGHLCNATGSVATRNGLAIILQFKLLEFLKSDLPDYTIKFDFDLSKKFVAFANFFVQRVNARGTPVCQTSIEYDLGMEILKYAKNKKISVDCDQNRSIIFRQPLGKYPNIESKELSDYTNNNNSITVNKNKEDAKIIEEELDEASVEVIQNVIGKDSKVTGNVENCVDDWNEIASDDSFVIKEEVNEKTSANEKMSRDVSFSEEIKQEYKNIVHEDIAVNGQEISNSNINTDSKRARSDSDDSIKLMKKTKIDAPVTYLFLKPEDSDDISNDQVKKFQSALADKIYTAANRPLLECHGVENGTVIYGCYNEVGVALVKSVASQMEFTVKEHFYREGSNRKMKVIVNSYFGINLKKFFNTIESYNDGLSTESWAVLDVEVSRGQIVLLLDIDHVSLQHIVDNNFRLFAGIDRLRFSIAWD
ncbi:hypothetical protein evm_001759 [Chilo suppressalis]|nr:hypothetical protein evm_001759 [Chilo suppressalis]